MFQLILSDVFISSSASPPDSYDFILLQKGGRQLPIHRSHSVPELNKDGSVSLGSVFRVIPTTPRAMERSVSITSCTSPKDDNGKFMFQLSFTFLFTSFSLQIRPSARIYQLSVFSDSSNLKL